MKLIKMKCENCGATLEVNQELDKVTCNFCGADNLIDDAASELRRVEDVKLQARKQNHEQTLKEKQDLEALHAVDNFKKGKLSKVLLIFAAICLIVVFSSTFSFRTIIALIQVGLFLGAWLLGMEIIKVPNKKLYIVLAIAGFALIVPYFALSGGKAKEEEKLSNIDLSKVELKDYLPIPDKTYGKITNDSKSILTFDINDITKEDYKDYINKKVIPFGYDLDLEYESWDTVYGAFNKDGYSIRIVYLDYNKYMSVTLESPEELENIEWPTIGLATKVPTPSSLFGNISYDNDEDFIVHIGNTTLEDYNDYVKACESAGYTLEHSKETKSYRAKNKDGYELHLMYLGGNVMEISVKAKEDINNNNNNNNNSNNNTNNNTKLDSKFKKAMDDYEAFIDKYISLYKKYMKNPTNSKLQKDYMDYLKKLEKMNKSFDEWEGKDLSAAELEYYIKVQTRVNKKLANIAN